MSRNITKQLEHAVHACYSPNHSNRADKFNRDVDTSWKIYSFSSRRDMLDLARDFGKYIRLEYSQLNRANFIAGEVLQGYLHSRANTCVDGTLNKLISHLGKLEKCYEHTYPNTLFDWGLHEVRKPQSTKNAEFKKDTPVPIEVSKELMKEMSKRHSEV